MSKKRSRQKIVSETAGKTIIKITQVDQVLTEEEVETLLEIIYKLKQYDEETKRLQQKKVEE